MQALKVSTIAVSFNKLERGLLPFPLSVKDSAKDTCGEIFVRFSVSDEYYRTTIRDKTDGHTSTSHELTRGIVQRL